VTFDSMASLERSRQQAASIRDLSSSWPWPTSGSPKWSELV
jgi:hypothetical protein